MDKSEIAAVGFVVLIFGLVIASIVGWCLNIYQLVQICCEPLTGEAVLRIVGIFVAPLGAVLGYV